MAAPRMKRPYVVCERTISIWRRSVKNDFEAFGSNKVFVVQTMTKDRLLSCALSNVPTVMSVICSIQSHRSF